MSQSVVHEQLERILATPIFSRSERLTAFLRFVVEETLAGRGDTLKEQTIAEAVYRRQLGANGDDNSVVRADARRVRDKLREYYAEAVHEPVIISLPKGGYSPAFVATGEVTAPAQSPRQPSKRRIFWIGGAVSLAVLAGGFIWWLTRPSPPPSRIVSLTQYPGGESDPTFSPDGNFVAFAWWHSPGPAPQDIWIKAVNGDALRRLTDTPPPVAEHSPCWSPDGKEIAFERVGWAGQHIPNAGVFVVSVLGGPERRISDSGRNPKWTSDARSLLIVDGRPSSIVKIDLATLHRRQIYLAPAGESIGKFDLSPDGATIAFIRSRRAGVSDVYIVPSGGGEERKLTDWGALMEGVAWTPDGRDIIYDVGGQALWRIPARTVSQGKGTPVPGLESLVTSAARALKPVISPAGPGRPARLAFQIQKGEVSLRMIDLEAPLSDGALQAKAFLDSTGISMPGPFSPDGGSIAFYSNWARFPALFWVAKRDGSGLRQIESIKAPLLRLGSWSPDGRRIALDAAVDGNSDVYTVGENGGEPKRLTNDTTTEVNPSWSQDGRSIYYSSNRTGRPRFGESTLKADHLSRSRGTGEMSPSSRWTGKRCFSQTRQEHSKWFLSKAVWSML